MKLSKRYLESLSVDELLKLCDIYGIFVPKGLDRKFAIEELLFLDDSEDSDEEVLTSAEIISEFIKRKEKECDDCDDDDLEGYKNKKLSKKMSLSYHLTGIHILLRDPMWLFVFWDFSKKEFKELTEASDFDCFVLRVSLFNEDNRAEPYDYYDIAVSKEDRSRYLHLSFDDVLTRIDICVKAIDNNVKIISQSSFVYLRRANIPKKLCALNNEIDKVSTYSGLSILKKSHFTNYRQAFRDYGEK